MKRALYFVLAAAIVLSLAGCSAADGRVGASPGAENRVENDLPMTTDGVKDDLTDGVERGVNDLERDFRDADDRMDGGADENDPAAGVDRGDLRGDPVAAERESWYDPISDMVNGAARW